MRDLFNSFVTGLVGGIIGATISTMLFVHLLQDWREEHESVEEDERSAGEEDR